MKIFKRLQELREADRAATRSSRAVVEEISRTDSHIEKQHEVALARLRESTEQAELLQAADRRNHYSESLTRAFRGRTAT